MKAFWKMMLIFLVGTGLVLTGLPAVYGQEEEEGEKEVFVLEEVVVTAERGEALVLDRPMTVTGFNEQMVEQLGIQNEDDLEVLVPGLQVGNRSQGSGKNEDDHYYMRGIGSERTVNFFSDTAVAVYIDGVWTDQTYGTDGFFDMERVEVTRGPQGTTGGKAALAGAISFHSRKPTETFSAIAQAEFTDQFTQQYQLAFGGPIMDSNFLYRLRFSYLDGEGQIENVYPGGRDPGKPEQVIWAPALRYKTDRMDITLRYSNQEDTGTPDSSLFLGTYNTVEEFELGPDGDPVCSTNTSTGETVCQRNPFYGAPPSPTVANCSNVRLDGTVDPFNLVCDPDELEHEVALNAPIFTDSSAEAATLDASFNITDSLVLTYRFGWRDTVYNNLNDSDLQPREGGGLCPFDHPKVEGGMLTVGQTSRFCALDGGVGGTFENYYSQYEFTSEQYSHELSFYSDFDGPFNFTIGAVFIDGEEPYDYRGWNNGSETGRWQFEDTSAQCEALIDSLYGAGGSLAADGSRRLRDFPSDPYVRALAAGWTQLVACPGSPEIMNHGAGTNYTANMNGQEGLFTGNAEYETQGAYLSVEYQINDAFKAFAGIRTDSDTKAHPRNDWLAPFALNAAEPVVVDDVWYQDSNGDWQVRQDWAENYCDNDSGEDCIGVVGGWMRNSSVEGYEGKNDVTWGETTWNIGLEYRPVEDVMVYGRVSTGYRAGGLYGWWVTSEPWGYPAEEMTNYEIGAKGLFFDNVLQLEATYFFQDFSSYHIFASRLRTEAEVQADPRGGITSGEVTSMDGTTIGGIELQGAWRITDDFMIRGFYNWLDANLGSYNALYPYAIPGVPPPVYPDDYTVIEYTDLEGNPVTGEISNRTLQLEGRQLVNQPQHKGSLTLVYDTPLPEQWGGLELLTTYSYTSKKFVEQGNFDAYAIQPYHRWDIRANWRSPDQKWTVTLFVQNLLDQQGLQMYSPRENYNPGTQLMDPPVGTLVEPREIGLSITFRI